MSNLSSRQLHEIAAIDSEADEALLSPDRIIDQPWGANLKLKIRWRRKCIVPTKLCPMRKICACRGVCAREVRLASETQTWPR